MREKDLTITLRVPVSLYERLQVACSNHPHRPTLGGLIRELLDEILGLREQSPGAEDYIASQT